MKRIIISLIFIVTIATIQAQCNLPYKNLSAFSNDTIAFMKYNFIERTSCYKGKTVNEVLNDLNLSKISVKSYAYRLRRDRTTDSKSMITSITLYIYDGKTVDRKLDLNLRGTRSKLNSVKIFLETPIESKNIDNLLTNNPNTNWTSGLHSFFSTKKIKEIKFRE